MYVHMHTCHDVWKSKDNLRELVLYFHQIVPRDQTPVIRLATVSSWWPIIVHLIFLKFNVYMCVIECIYVCHVYAMPMSTRRHVGYQEPELQAVVSCSTWVMGTQPRFSGRAATSSAPK